MSEAKNNNPCFISELPAPLIHHILSLLSNKDSAKTCILSKTWNNLYASRHIMVFHEGDFKVSKRNKIESKMLFMNYIDQSLNRISKPLERFELQLKGGPCDRVREWLEKVFGVGVKTMSLELGCGDNLSGLVFVCQTLVEVHVQCYFFMRACTTISLPNLKVLSLSHIALSDESLKMLSSGCPMVMVLRLVKCSCTSRELSFSGFTRLVELGLCACERVRMVEICSPNFETFSFVGGKKGPSTIELMGSCERVRKLELNAWLSTKFSAFECLEELTLTGICIMSRISSQSVKRLVIESCGSKTEVIEIDCPNLMSFKYENIYRPVTFVSACNPIDFRYELSMLQRTYSGQMKALENFFQSTFAATRHLKVVIAYGRCKATLLEPIVIVEGLYEIALFFLRKMEDLVPVLSISSHSVDWHGILSRRFPKVAQLSVYVFSSPGSRFITDVWEKLLTLYKSRIERHAIRSVAKSEWSISFFPKEQLQYHGSQYQVHRIVLEFD